MKMLCLGSETQQTLISRQTHEQKQTGVIIRAYNHAKFQAKYDFGQTLNILQKVAIFPDDLIDSVRNQFQGTISLR